ncbi:MAG: ribonuclease J [Actinobacteria bacterium]|nr:ribonuclease J [Actinomycetota bacterium]
MSPTTPTTSSAGGVRISFLGGLGEIGRNCMAVEHDGRMLLIDCGLMFPDADMHGIDLVLPDFTYLRTNADRIEGCVITHGHEDHVGALQYLLRDLSFPIFGSPVALGLARNRIEEAGLLGRTQLVPVKDGERRRIGPFDVEFIPVTHSVPHAHAIALHTPQGVVLHSGDFKLDLTPVDRRVTDLGRIGAIASTEGIRLLMADSTNAEEHGYAPSETSVGAVLRQLFMEQADRRIITASFASHLHRIQQIADAAIATGRVVATLGLSMKKNVRLGRDLGILKIPDASLIDVDDIDQYPPGRVCSVSTGSHREPMAALALLARSGIADVHATGHAQADELKTYLSIARPEWYVPIHGEYRHMVANSRLGHLMGVPRDHVLLCEDGDVLEITEAGVAMAGRIPAGYMYVDGIVGDVGQGVLRDRRVLAEEGVVVVVVTVDVSTGKVLTGPEIITRGWVYAPEAEDLLDEACDTVAAAVESALANGVRDVENLERDVRRAAGKFVNERTRRRPMIVPVVMEA